MTQPMIMKLVAPLMTLVVINLSRHEATALTLAPRPPATSSKIVFGIETSNGEIWTDQVQAQLETWAADIPKEFMMIVGGPYGKTPCEERDSSCKEAVLMYRARSRMQQLNAGWLLALHEDAYVVLEHMPKLKELDPRTPQILSMVGCGQGWEYHPESKNGTVPRPDGYIEPKRVCDSVWKHGSLCSAAGMFVSIGALDALTHGLREDEFIKAHRDSLDPTLRVYTEVQCDMPTSCLAHERGVKLAAMSMIGLGMGQPMSYKEFETGVTDEHVRNWLASDRMYGDWDPTLIHVNIPKQDIPSFMRSLHRVRASPPRSSKVRGLQPSVSLALIVDPAGAVSAKELLVNFVEQLSKGPAPVKLSQVLLFYDGRDKGKGWGSFLEDVEELKGKGLLQRAVKIRYHDPAIEQQCGIHDPDGHDGSLFATYQYLVEECESEYCAYFNSDIFVHQGGGLSHAVKLLEQHPDLVFAMPPLASDAIIQNRELQEHFMNGDFKYPYPNPIGRLSSDTLDNSQQECNRGGNMMTTRYYVAKPDRFRELLPLKPVDRTLLEQHEDLGKHGAQAMCAPSQGWVIHPPPWGLGTRLFSACDYKALQKAVDNSDSLMVDVYNNMIMESWRDACTLHK